MAIHFVTGKPGGGKTLFAVKQIITELVSSERDVVTNVPLKVDRLNEYLQQRYPDRYVPLIGPESRLRLLDDSEASRRVYWDYRDAYYRAAPDDRERVYEEFERKIKTLLVSEETRKFWLHRNPRKKRFDEAVGTLFVLDEVHLHFNARKWAETGPEALDYLSQHRKLSDDVILVTQHADNVDVQFRRVVEDWSVIKNGYRQKLGWFRGLPRFSRRTYAAQPTGGNKQEPFESASFTLDAKGVASCYDTAAGVGVLGRDADRKAKARGLHPAWFIVGMIAMGLGFSGCVKFLVHRQTKSLEAQHARIQAERKESQATAPATRSDLAQLEKAAPMKNPEPVAIAEKSRGKEAQEGYTGKMPELYVTGVSQYGRKVIVNFSDGTMATGADEGLEWVSTSHVKYEGRKIPRKVPSSDKPRVVVKEVIRESGPVPPAEPERVGSFVRDADGVMRSTEPQKLGEWSSKAAVGLR